MKIHVGERVRIQRDEKQYPPKGTWPRYRGRVATVVSLNDETCTGCDKHAPGEVFHSEIGVNWSNETDLKKAQADVWFMPWELVVISEQQYEGERLGIVGPVEPVAQPLRRARSRR